MIIDHLKHRDVPDTARVFVDIEENLAYFTLFNLSGKIVGFMRYNPVGHKARGKWRKETTLLKYKTVVTKENDERNISHLALYGLHTLDERPFVFVVEGIFDAVKLETLKLPVIATLTNDPKKLKNFFFILSQTKDIIAWLDRDVSGKKLRKIAKHVIVTPEPYGDLGDMPIDEIKGAVGEELLRLRND